MVLIVLATGIYFFFRVQWGPYGPGGIVYIPKGYSVQQIAGELVQAKILRNTWSFRILVRWRQVGAKLQAGEYEFPPQVTTAEVIDKLVRGDRLVRRFTIPEGANFNQIAQIVGETGIATPAEFKAAFRDPLYLAKLGFPALSLEGYLFPATYDYDRSTQLKDLLGQMIQAFQKSLDPELKARAAQGGWTIPQLVTLASIIEKETGQAAERPLIASVFHNRLKIGMPLQSDPTIIYGLKNFDGNIRRGDIRNPHPYNTYVHVGLPPGPIASPGKESIRAVLYPATSDYLFFVSKGDGSHQFSETLAEHNAAVRKYQLAMKNKEVPVETRPQVQSSPRPKAVRPIMKPIPVRN